MYAGASVAVAFGVANGWTSGEFRVYWALGAVLNVPFLAAGELDLLVRRRDVRWSLYVVLAFVTAYTDRGRPDGRDRRGGARPGPALGQGGVR